MIKLMLGDCIEKLKELPDNCVDAICCDPPYELGFMGKGWDNTGIANNINMWKECLRVLKPGGHILVAGIGRTHHRMMCAVEDAGFEIRDCVYHAFGSGFPKSTNIEKQLIKKGLVEESKKFSGWGTALKPAVEIWVMARKPISEKTVAENCLKWGVGGINIDESRVGTGDDRTQGGTGGHKTQFVGGELEQKVERATGARFPSNLIHDNSEEVRECFPETNTHGGGKQNTNSKNNWFGDSDNREIGNWDSGNASRFFKSIIYTAKASKSERNLGCEKMEDKIGGGMKGTEDKTLLTGSGNVRNNIMKNNHPTVKPIALMEYLIKMITPNNGTVLDPFMGSGTTGMAAKKLKYSFIGIEKEPEYMKIAEARIKATQENLI